MNDLSDWKNFPDVADPPELPEFDHDDIWALRRYALQDDRRSIFSLAGLSLTLVAYSGYHLQDLEEMYCLENPQCYEGGKY